MPLPVRTFEVRKAHLIRITAIDMVNQTFDAQFFLEFCIRGGADDEYLWGENKNSEDWPTDTNNPPAKWFLKQFDCPTALSWKALESKAYFSKPNDLVLQQRIEGTFMESFELNAFPYDTQCLTLRLSLLCAQEGHVPVEILVPEGVLGLIDTEECMPTLSQNFRLNSTFELTSIFVGSKDANGVRMRTFPALQLQARVRRYAAYYTANAVAPMGCFSLLTLVTFLPRLTHTHTAPKRLTPL